MILCICKLLKCNHVWETAWPLTMHTSLVKAWVLEFKTHHQECLSTYSHIPKSFMTVTSWEPGVYHYHHVYKTEPKSKAERGKVFHIG